ncbi:MAG: VWA domain-containing protein [Cyanobacteria bacterium]|nr:VWA domain-containing protein [Cyanobacteriota bacterium]
MVAAKRVILDFIKNLPPSINVGLRIYGQSDNSFVACRATQLLMPISRNNHLAMASRLLGVRPTGATPITHAIKTAINEDFRGITGKKSIILVSDGMETCDADPCDTAVEMVRAGINVKINVIGLGLNDFNATKQLKCVALSTLGKYYGANTAAELARSLSQHGQDIQTDVQGQILTPTKR